MSVHLVTPYPNSLLSSFKKAIDDGRIVTWSYDTAGDFTHVPDQWKYKAWMRPKVQNDRLILIILKPTNGKINKEVYAVYHGRFIESALAHFDTDITNALATPLPADGDLI